MTRELLKGYIRSRKYQLQKTAKSGLKIGEEFIKGRECLTTKKQYITRYLKISSKETKIASFIKQQRRIENEQEYFQMKKSVHISITNGWKIATTHFLKIAERIYKKWRIISFCKIAKKYQKIGKKYIKGGEMLTTEKQKL